MNPAFECLVEDCKVVIPSLMEGMQKMAMDQHNSSTHGSLFAPLERGGDSQTATAGPPKSPKLVVAEARPSS